MEPNTTVKTDDVKDKAVPGKHSKRNKARRAKAKAEKAELDAFVAGVKSQFGDGSPLADLKFMVDNIKANFDWKRSHAMGLICSHLNLFLQRREKGPRFTDQEINYINEIADEMIPDRAGPEPMYDPRVTAMTVLPISDDISPQLSTETRDEPHEDTHAKNPSLNGAGEEVMTARNKVAAGFVRRLWDPYVETQREGKPFTEKELAYTEVIEAKIANDTGLDWSLTAYNVITIVMPFLLRRNELALQDPTDAVIHDMAICEEKYEYEFARFARIFDIVVPLPRQRLALR